jgi:phage terminase small subunit
MADLTAKQEAFCLEYVIDNNATQAAIRAGYSETSARQIAADNMSKHDIADRIAVLRAEISAETLVDAKYVINGLLEVHERCMQKEPVMIREGDEMIESGEFKFEHSGANKSLELLGKHLGLFVDKKEVSGPNGGPIGITAAVVAAEMTNDEASNVYKDLMG